MKKNKIYLVVDRSGSMSFLQKQAVNLVNGTLRSSKKENEKAKQRTEVSVILFNTTTEFIRKNKNITNVAPVTSDEYYPFGGTSLFDAVSEAITDGFDSDDADDTDTSFIVLAITDGEENSSSTGSAQLNKLIRKAEKTGRWTITFQVPHGYRHQLKGLGISNDNIAEWEVSDRGIKEAEVRTSTGLTNYYAARSRGLKAVNNFYETDLSGLSTRQLKRELNDLSHEYGIFSVPKDVAIKDYVEDSLNRPYVKGEAFYQLTKTETIQGYKDILIFDKNKTTIYGGDEARDLIGLTTHKDAKVIPGDHASYEIFVQSTSVNRKLLKGTKVAVKVT